MQRKLQDFYRSYAFCFHPLNPYAGPNTKPIWVLAGIGYLVGLASASSIALVSANVLPDELVVEFIITYLWVSAVLTIASALIWRIYFCWRAFKPAKEIDRLHVAAVDATSPPNFGD